MLLPKKHLKLISYWEEKDYLSLCSGCYETKVTIHYEAWYKFPKSFTFFATKKDENYYRSELAQELIDQLKTIE
jgi:hypothetical protein